MSLHRQDESGEPWRWSARTSSRLAGTARHAPPPAPDRFTGLLEVIQIGLGQWRVRDSRIPSDDARNLLGFIEYTGRSFDVLAVCAPRERISVPEFSDALAELATHVIADWPVPAHEVVHLRPARLPGGQDR